MMKLLIKQVLHVETCALVIIIVSLIIFMAVGVSGLRRLLCPRMCSSLLLLTEEIFAAMISSSVKNCHNLPTKCNPLCNVISTFELSVDTHEWLVVAGSEEIQHKNHINLLV